MAEKLFTEFPPVSTESWEEVINKDLKGADYEKKLVWRTLEGFKVRPYYREEDLQKIEHIGTMPGQYPFVRGIKKDNNWLIRQTFCTKEGLKEANAKAVDALKKGLESVSFHIDGEHAYTKDEIATLLCNIDLATVEVNFEGCCCANTEILKSFLLYAESCGVAKDDVMASFDFDPLQALNKNGKFCVENSAAVLAELTKTAEDWKNIRTIGVNGSLFNCAGASCVQELAYSLSMASQYMNWMTDNGVLPSVAARNIKFNMAVGSNYFMEIAKFRAARMLWASIATVYGVTEEENQKMIAHAKTSSWNQTVYDMYVNMLRGTTETMSATIAGVHSIEVTPFDTPIKDFSDFGKRIARNVQIILKEEAHFDKVTDPAGGSYYIEQLTASISQAAWSLFKEIEDGQGYVKAFTEGKVQDAIEATAAQRDKNIACRKETLLGVNQFPNFTEKANEHLTDEMLQPVTACTCQCQQIGRPLKQYRGAEAFEALRYATDKSGKQPKAFMLTFGNLAMCRARAQFSSNFFAVAGYKIIDNNRFASIEEGVKAALEAKAELVIACSSDDEYAEAVPQIAELIGKNAIVVVAGDPACKEDLQAKGINHFISVRNNVLETLTGYQKEFGIL